PVVLNWSVSTPIAVLKTPVLFTSASSPSTVLLLVKQPSWQPARACGASAKEASTDRMSSKATWQDERFLKFFNGRVVVFIWGPYEITAPPLRDKKPQFSQRFTERRATPSPHESSKQHTGQP